MEMGDKRYDAIVVGARCAGSPTAMLLAGRGYEVLVVDRATFPSDTVSTHLIHPPGVAALRRWGLLDRLVETGCPSIHTYSFDFGPFTLSGAPGTDDTPDAYGPRRTVLDHLLVEAAAKQGAEVREGFTVEQVITEDGRVTGIRGHGRDGRTVTERARVVVGADGRHSLVARAVRPEQYNEKPHLLCGYYSYWSGLPMDGRFETYIRPDRGFAAWPTSDDLTLVIAGWPFAEFEANRDDVEGNYLKMLELAPAFAERVRAARREERFVGTSVANYFRKPYGPGWALVGDAGYNKDFITAQGIQDAFRDAELCAGALHEAFSGASPYDDAMARYQAARDEQVLPMYEFTTQLATLEPPPPDLARLLGAMPGNQPAMDGFARVNAGVTSPAVFFSEENVTRILSRSGPAEPA
jgi:2-polyprenyl-6-methoxyphenol hydroxylase-like FAD-dependent oxidoreductase